MAASDPTIDAPPHYVAGRRYEPVEVILDWSLDYLTGQVVRYLARAGRKGARLEDLRKAAWYLQRAIRQAEAADSAQTTSP